MEVLDDQGEVIEGMTSKAIRLDGVRLKVDWPERRHLSDLGEKPVQLRFRLKNARLYSWQID